MSGINLPEIPAPLKPIQQHLKIALTHDERDPVVSYWCRLYALQTGLKLSTKSTEETNFLLKLMDWLEETKKKFADNEAITNDVAAQAHLENWALKLFLFADQNDRAGNFARNVIQSFFTAGLLYDVLTVFGELTEEASQNRKYAKWKAAYIHSCIKNGETPKPGPMSNDESESIDQPLDDAPSQKPSSPPGTTNMFDFPAVPSNPSADGTVTPESKEDNTNDSNNGNSAISRTDSILEPIRIENDANLTVEQMAKAQKYIKWAGSALNYDDVSTAVTNLQKALHLLTTGQDPA